MSKRGEEMKKKLREKKEEPDILEIIRQWRFDRFKEVYDDIGYKAKNATIDKLVASEASPHDAEKLFKDGCPPQLIAKILV